MTHPACIRTSGDEGYKRADAGEAIQFQSSSSSNNKSPLEASPALDQSRPRPGLGPTMLALVEAEAELEGHKSSSVRGDADASVQELV